MRPNFEICEILDFWREILKYYTYMPRVYSDTYRPRFFPPKKFWGEDDGPTVVVWESLSESEQEQWSEKMGKSKDWAVWCRSRKKDTSKARLKSMEKKSSQTAASKPNPKQERRRI